MTVARVTIPLLLLTLSGCGAGGGPYGPAWSEQGYADRIHAGRPDRATDGNALVQALSADPDFGEAVAIAESEAAIRRGHSAPGSLSALQRGRRDAAVDRQRGRYLLAENDRFRAAAARAEAARELSRAERLDRRPVGTDPFDLADAERRQAALELGRAAQAGERAERLSARAERRLRLLEREAGILERMDRIERVQRRQEARERLLATRGVADAELRRLLPYRQTGESITEFRARVERARSAAARAGTPVERLLAD